MTLKITLTAIENGKQLSIDHLAEYTYIESALKSRWSPMNALRNDIRDFAPRPLASFVAEREFRLNEYRTKYNRSASEARLNEIVDRDMTLLCSPQSQYDRLFDERVAQEYVISCLLSHSLCEALVNYVLSIGLVRSQRASIFKEIEKEPFFDKWTLHLASLWPDCKPDKGSALFQTLKKLNTKRNALTSQNFLDNQYG